MQLLSHFLKRRVAAQLPMELVPLAQPTPERFPRMGWNANRFGLFIDGTANGLLDPVSAVSGETEAFGGIKFIDGMHQAQIAFFNDVEKVQAGPVILLGNGDDQTQIAFDQFFFCRFVALVGPPPKRVEGFAGQFGEILNSAEIKGYCV